MTDAVFFPGAGSFGGEFRPLTRALGPASWLVRYPGRHGRGFGVPAASFEAVVGACTEQIVRRAVKRPLLFGHSYGAYVACATAARLRESGVEVASLVAAGAAAPGRLELPEQAVSSPSEAAAYLEEVDPGLLAGAASDEWREVVAETTAQDLRLLGEFDPADVPPLPCRIWAARGADDPLTTDDSIADWRNVTTDRFTSRTFPGGHSDLLGSPDCASWLQEAVRAAGT